MMELLTSFIQILASAELLPGLIIVLVSFVLAGAGWLLYKIDPSLTRIAENNLVIAKVQETTALSLKATADLLQGLTLSFATHDQKSNLIYDACKDQRTMFCDTKDTFVDYHREIMTKLTEIQGELRMISPNK